MSDTVFDPQLRSATRICQLTPMSDFGGLKAVLIAERPLLLRLLRARAQPPDDAEDLWQEMWLKVETTPAGPVGDPVAFLCRTAINLASDRRRARLRATIRDATWRDLQPGDDEQPGIVRELMGRDELRRVEQAIADMPDRTREALHRFRFEGASQRNIAEEMGISVSGVEKLLKRAYRLLDEIRFGEGAGDGIRRRLPHEGASTDD
jgi:RNA polymerase sigma factor (sigma-70 family)